MTVIEIKCPRSRCQQLVRIEPQEPEARCPGCGKLLFKVSEEKEVEK